MKRQILYFLLVLILVASCSKIDKGYEALEKGLIGIFENRDQEYVLKQLEISAKNGNKDVYSLIYLYLGENGEIFFDNFLKKSDGVAEYYKALIRNQLGASEEEIIREFESSVKQGNIKAYYMLGNIHQDKLEFSKAQEYFEKGKNLGEMYATYAYNYNKNLLKEYKRIEELNKKMIENNITRNEKKELGMLVLEKFSDYDRAYDILKEFIVEENSTALYTKAKKLEMENKREEALQIYSEIFFKNKYYLAGFEIAYNLVNGSQNYDLALKVLDDTNSEEILINGYKGFIYENLEQYDKSEEHYKKALKKNDMDIMVHLGRLYEIENKTEQAKEIYAKAYHLGSIEAGHKLANIIEGISNNEINNDTDKTIEKRKEREAKEILEKLADSDDIASLIDLSLYYEEDSEETKINNLKAATRFNPTALYNLGVYYYNKKDDYKAKLYLQVAKEEGYTLEEVFEEYIKG